ncbi:hypothetical protein [Camelliibacillus cellulosilyticus]
MSRKKCKNGQRWVSMAVIELKEASKRSTAVSMAVFGLEEV